MMTADRILNPSSLWRHILAAVSSSGSTKVAHATTPHALRLFSSSISSTYAAPVPPRTLPTSQLEAKTTISRTAVEQATKYPRHPLNQFFHFVTPRTEGGLSIPKAVIPGLDFGRGTSSRSWRAPELRRKSSMELHQLWYILAMERNRLATKWDELKRAGAKNNVLQLGETIRVRMKQVRKSQARVKFTLNERRLALIEAQNFARAHQSEAGSQELLDEGVASPSAMEKSALANAENRERAARQDAAHAALEEQINAMGADATKFSMGSEEAAGQEGVTVGQQQSGSN